MLKLTAEPLSPELILVSPPEEAALAREQLPDPPTTLRRERREISADVATEVPSEVPVPSEIPVPDEPSDAKWNDFLADVRSRSVEPVGATRPRPRPSAPVTRKGRRRLLVAIVAIVAVGAVVGLGWARDRAQQHPGSSASPKPRTHAGTTPAAPVTTAPKAKSSKPAHPTSTTPAHHARTKPAPAVTTAPKAKSSKPSSRSHGGGFVPTRTWSWAAAPAAGAYVVRFLRDDHEVLKMRTAIPRLVLPSRFSFAPGRYRWTVTAVPRTGKGGRVIINSTFTVGASNG